jgi:hypothetical protein
MLEAPAMPAPSHHQGCLAIFSDVKPEDETDYLHWLTREHAQERLGVPGFLSVRVFRAEADGTMRFLIFYRLSAPDAVASEAYLARLNAPSEWSQRIMPKLTNFMRGGGSIVHEFGEGEGTLVAPVLFEAAAIEPFRAAAEHAVTRNRMLAARILLVDQPATIVPTREKAMRQGDAAFAAMLLLEGLDERALGAAAESLPVDEPAKVEFYRQVFALRASRS